jgi:general secretion pathway protein C
MSGMTKYYYITLGSIGAVLLIALTILSYVDKSMLYYPSKTSPESANGLTREINQTPFPGRQTVKPGVSSTPSQRASGNRTAPASPSLNLRLVGTTVFGDKSTAIIEDSTMESRGVYRLGDSIKGFTITSILQDSVTLTAPDRTVVLTRAPGADQLQPDSFFTKLDDSSWLVSADKVSDMVSNIDQYVGQVVAFQHREQGESAGFRIRHLQEGNDFEKLGIKNEDIIKRVNGLELNDLTDVIKAVYQLGNETSFTIEVERDNQLKALNYSLDGDVNALVPIISRMLTIPLGGMGAQ